MNIRFCRRCGGPLACGVPPGDDRERAYCASCGHVEYHNPRVRAGCLARTTEGEVVLCTTLLLPGERVQAGALRAMAASIPEEELRLYCAITDTAAAEVCLVFRAVCTVASGPGSSSADAPPGWGASLLERFAADGQGTVVPVYTAEVEGGRLCFAAVSRG